MSSAAEITSAGKAFSKQSSSFDEIDDASVVIKWMRKLVYHHTEKWLKPESRILELNAGTGIDACHFASLGHTVLATDISADMLHKAQEKVTRKGLLQKIATQQCDYTQLDRLEYDQKFDYLFSDFGGLNCVGDFEKVGRHFRNLIKPGGYVTLVMISPFCFWETLLAFKGNFSLAFRRFKKDGAPSQLEGVDFTTYYFWPSELQKAMGQDFKRVSLEGLAVFSPPPYLEERFSKGLLKALFSLDEKVSKWPFLRMAGDHYIATFQYQP